MRLRITETVPSNQRWDSALNESVLAYIAAPKQSLLMQRGFFMSFRGPSLLIPMLAFVASSAFAQAQRPAKVDDAALRNAAQGKGDDWLSYGFTPQETRYSPLSQINASNVSRLGLAWSYEIGRAHV